MFKLIYANKSEIVRKRFSFSLSVYQLNCLRTIKGLSLGELIRLQRIYLVLDSNLHDLNETNPGLTLFSAELPWCCFCAEIKVLEMERNFAMRFYIINKNFWSQDLLERGTWLGTTHQGAPPLLARPSGLSPPGGPAGLNPDTIKSHIWRKN